jgi:hypothetical protein
MKLGMDSKWADYAKVFVSFMLFFVSRTEVFMSMKIQIVVFLVLTPFNYVVGCHRFGGACCLHFQGISS